jgi:dynein heavy chain
MAEVHLPRLLKTTSWTKASPYKEEKHHRTISDSIGNNYSPKAASLNAKSLSGERRRFEAAIGNLE